MAKCRQARVSSTAPMRATLAALAAAFIAIITSGQETRAEVTSCAGAPVQVEVPRGTPYSLRLAEKAQALTGTTKAVVLGDSDAGRWPADELEPILGSPVLNLAHGGDRFENTRWIVDQVDPQGTKAISSVVLMVGSNSVNRDEPCSLQAKARALLGALEPRFPAARIFVVNILQKGRAAGPMAARVRAANEVLRRVSAELGLRYVDVHAAFAGRCGETTACPLFAADGVHPSVAGFDLMSRVLADAAKVKPG